MNTELFAHGEKITKESPEKSTRMLGIHINPALNWKRQFEVMRKKLNISITYLCARLINMQ